VQTADPCLPKRGSFYHHTGQRCRLQRKKRKEKKSKNQSMNKVNEVNKMKKKLMHIIMDKLLNQ
jgi:hypothetical protein